MRDLELLASWHADWTGLRAAVLGLGVTGFAAADTLVELGARVLVVAAIAPSAQADVLAVIGAELCEHHSVDSVPARLVDFDPEVIVVSPGFHPDHVILTWAAAKKIAVWGDIELAWRLRDKVGEPADWYCVTGTNGKTTTVQLAAHLMRADGRRVAAVGNIGIPVLDAVRDPVGFDAFVVELSSYQLHWVPREGSGALRPNASVCLNVADDHLDWHGTREAYAAAKATVYWNTRVACIYNLHDHATRVMVENADVAAGCRAVGFGLVTPGPSDVGMVDDIMIDRAFHADRHHSALELTTHGELAKVGLASPHLIADVLAAAALARAAGVEPAIIRDALYTFRVDHHRAELIAERDGVRWVDDSKATNPHAAAASLRAEASVVWILGGQLKGVDLSELVRDNAKRLRAAVVIGVERGAVLAAFGRHAPQTPVFEVLATDTKDVMPEAVRLAAEAAQPGDTILLAPAAASMDQFTSYADRGTRFVAAVEMHLGGEPDDDSEDSGLSGETTNGR